jgi:serine O-acetyltransferase
MRPMIEPVHGYPHLVTPPAHEDPPPQSGCDGRERVRKLGSKTMFERVRRDILRCLWMESETGNPGRLETIKILLNQHALKGIFVFRFGHWVRYDLPWPVLRKPLKLTYRLLDQLVSILWGMHIIDTADIQGGLYISHPDGVHIGPAIIGRDCNVGSNVLIGIRPGHPDGHKAAIIGDRVFIGPGSMLFGTVTIGEGTSIGPLTVVSRNLPPRCLAVGNPVKVVQNQYDNTKLIYGTHPPKE